MMISGLHVTVGICNGSVWVAYLSPQGMFPLNLSYHLMLSFICARSYCSLISYCINCTYVIRVCGWGYAYIVKGWFWHQVIMFQDLSTGWLHCDPGNLFKPKYYILSSSVPDWVRSFLATFSSTALFPCDVTCYLFGRLTVTMTSLHQFSCKVNEISVRSESCCNCGRTDIGLKWLWAIFLICFNWLP
jgi:hypothetical protein